MIAMINNERLHAGKSTVGFVNPVMYAHPEAFNDIETGGIHGCGESEAFPAAGRVGSGDGGGESRL
jgi:tripeptidyl-peptidase-1